MSGNAYTTERGHFKLRLVKVLRGHHGDVFCAAVDLDGPTLKHVRVITGGADRTVKIWQPMRHTHQTLCGHTETVTCIATAGNMIASGSLDHTVKCS
jgi:WD40 repeat protein